MAADREASFDLLVIGAGLAGLTAARRGQQLGARILVVEKGTEEDANNTRRSGGNFHAAYFDPNFHSPDEMYEHLMSMTDGHARPDVARAWADNVLRALDFLKAEGGVFERWADAETWWNRSGPPPITTAELLEREPSWKGAANDRFLGRLMKAFVAAGGTYRNGTRAVALETEGGAVVGVHVEPRSGGRRELVRGATVIMADGGFHANPELMRKYVTRHTYGVRCSDLDTGDCLQMAMAIGAKAVELDAAYQMIMLRDQVTHPRLHHPPSPTWLINAAMVVNGWGDRLGDEAAHTPPTSAGPEGGYPNHQWTDKRLCGLMTRTDAPGDSWVVFDDIVWNSAGLRTSRQAEIPESALPGAPSINPLLLEHGGTFLSAGSISDLARQAGLIPERLQKSVDAFNRFSREGVPLEPLRTERPKPIAQAPFHAIPIVPGIFFTMGGVLVNGSAEVLDERERPIPGLYAAGGTMGGLMGGPRDGYAGGWSEAATFGLLAGEHAARRARSAAAAI